VVAPTGSRPVADELIALEADLGVIVAYGGLIREPLLSAPRLGWINLHFSLLPRWRGPPRAARDHGGRSGDRGAVFQLVPELDAGDVFARRGAADRPQPDGRAPARFARRDRAHLARRRRRRPRRGNRALGRSTASRPSPRS
jgi:hypothetical protein